MIFEIGTCSCCHRAESTQKPMGFCTGTPNASDLFMSPPAGGLRMLALKLLFMRALYPLTRNIVFFDVMPRTGNEYVCIIQNVYVWSMQLEISTGIHENLRSTQMQLGHQSDKESNICSQFSCQLEAIVNLADHMELTDTKHARRQLIPLMNWIFYT